MWKDTVWPLCKYCSLLLLVTLQKVTNNTAAEARNLYLLIKNNSFLETPELLDEFWVCLLLCM